MKRKRKPLVFKDGFSESAWKSLVVKSIRIGWPQGLEAGLKRLAPSTFWGLVLGGFFEDTFPAGYDDVREAWKEVRNFDFEKFCQRDTHHGRGYTQEFYDLKDVAGEKGKIHGPEMNMRLATNAGTPWVRPFLLNCLWTWEQIMPDDRGVLRPIYDRPFDGMPIVVLDNHTYEGRISKRGGTFLSGSYETHLEISHNVQKHGWEYYHELMDECEIKPVFQSTLF